jgi:adenine-specific DNA-methyltransferase
MTELYFKGKEFVYNHHLAVPHRPLVPDAANGIGGPDLSGNLIIQGDNLHALKSLLPTHAGKVDCIFIDPPYNTGNENWRYNDNVNAPMIRDWMNDNPVGVDDGLRHDKWCAMMWPRLKLLHELLADTGSLWMTLDDNEAHRAKLILDEIFGAANFVANVVWQKRTSPDMRTDLGAGHDHLLVYARDMDVFRQTSRKLPKNETQIAAFKNPDNDTKGAWVSSDFTAQGYRRNQMYSITTPSGKIYEPPAGRCWKNVESAFLKLVEEGRIWFGQNGDGIPRRKTYLAESDGNTVWTWWPNAEVGHNQEAKKEVIQILGADSNFDTPKPTRLVGHIIKLAVKRDLLILDSFAGSGTTAHAVLKANAADGGNRKFILVEMEEDIADPVTAERVRRVINGYDHDGKTTDGLGGNFTFCTLGDPIDLDRILTGETLPAYDALAPVLYHMATSRTLNPASLRPDDHYVGAAGDEYVWMLYQPDLDWLKSDAAALTLTRARAIQASAPDKRHLVFAPARFVSEAVLREHGLNVAYVPFPNALYQIAREGI